MRAESVSSRPVWWHYLSVVVPRKLNPTFKKHAILRIGDGSNGDEQRYKKVEIHFTDKLPRGFLYFELSNCKMPIFLAR